MMAQIRTLQKNLGFAVAFVAHDVSLVGHFSDRLAVMFAGTIVEIGPTRRIFAAPGHPYTQGLLEPFPSVHGPNVPLRGCPGAPAMRDGAGPADKGEATPLLEAASLTRHFRIGGRFGRPLHAVDDVDLALNEREIVAPVGESGRGKSIVARRFAMVFRPTAGDIRFRGRPVGEILSRRDMLAYRAQVPMVFQDPFSSLNPVHAIGCALDRGLKLHRPSLARYPHQLSGEPPRVVEPGEGCRFRWRCPLAIPLCSQVPPKPRPASPGHDGACHVTVGPHGTQAWGAADDPGHLRPDVLDCARLHQSAKMTAIAMKREHER